MLNKTRLLTPGPTPLPERVRLAMARDMIHHRKSAFKEILRGMSGRLSDLFGTEGPVIPLSSTGTGAMTAAVHNLLRPGEKVLVIEGGKFAQRWSQIAATHGLVTLKIVVEWGQAVSPAQVEAALEADKDIKAVLVQHSETSTGVLHPVRELSQITSRRDTLLIVDGISAVGICPCPMDEWKIDCLLTGSQKGLMLPPGLALIALSPRAWKKAEAMGSDCFYFNLAKEREALTSAQTCFTSPVSLLVGLSESLDIIFEAGLETLYRKQWALTTMARVGSRSLGLDLLAEENYAWGVTSILLPEGVDGAELLRIAADDYGVYMAGGYEHLKGRMVRMGHMGWIDYGDLAAGLYALAMGLRETGGYSASRDYLENALAAYHMALKGQPGQLPVETGGII